MRVEVTTLADFIAEVHDSLESGATLMEDCVRFRIDRAAQQAEGISFDVGYHATAVVEGADNPSTRYLLDLTVLTGEDNPGDPAGTTAATAARARLVAELEPLGIKVRRGKVEVI